MNRLKVGDRIYAEHYDKIIAVYTVERMTATTAICGNAVKFKIEFTENGWITRIGDRDKWTSVAYWIETSERKEKLFRQNAIAKIKAYDYTKLSTDKIRTITEIIRL